MSYYCRFDNIRQKFIKHINQVEKFNELSEKEQDKLMFELHTDSVELNRLLSDYQQHCKQQNYTGVKQ